VDIGLYVHIPFCRRKCGYCDFYSVDGNEPEMHSLVEAVLTELEARLDRQDWTVETIFVGGGTPTSLPDALLDRLFKALGKIKDTCGTVEFTVEANPCSLTKAKADILRSHGVDRLSLGAQSFCAEELRTLDRLHQPEEITTAIELSRQSGFEHLNLDLIFGIPGQTLTSWLNSLEQAVALGPDHLSCYGLTYEPGTPLNSCLEQHKIIPIDQELEAKMYLACLGKLEEEGFGQYEISNFARPGGHCRHNLRYWRHRPGIGIGPAASSYLRGCRWRNVPDIGAYMNAISAGEEPVAEFERLSPLQHAGEVAMLRLRLAEGINPEDFRKQTGLDLYETFGDSIKKHINAGLLEIFGENVRLTRKGMLLADEVITEFLCSE
jgi:oxygen-independent coproporphyrinogen-3 oxidase